ncbi:DUF2142 domain-containing protein [Caballeronia novacaledonica]|uniref:DUF2142 domain-containing protein n=1 Tax=Caballeronia novacaledonica TaxID=1544861 RepID=A0AA37I9Y0_9BURK|nr:DUF2142 domain-containing protein [Caballeronia novacaledonica]GJH26020.1 DUF2142 domain-containing protein [Caballeronia novacaledonica]
MSYLERFVQSVRHNLAIVYACLAIPTGLFLATTTPPLQTPDAIFHVYRTFQVSNGGFVARRVGGSSGGQVDVALVDLANLMFPMATRPEVKYDASLRAKAVSLRWTGHLADAEFPGSAIYPAYAYIPQAVAIRVGRALHLSVVRSYTLACVFDLLVSVALTAWAIFIGRRVSLAIFTVGLLPCALMLFGSVSDEVLLIPTCFLLIAYADRFMHENRLLRGRDLIIGGALATLCITARPPYAGLLLLAFMPGLRFDPAERDYRLLRRLVVVIVTGVVSFGFIELFNHSAWTPVAPPRSISGQIQFLASQPMDIPRIAWATLQTWGAFYWVSFVGVLGWLDTHMHQGYYRIAIVALLLALGIPALNARLAERHALQNRCVLLFACLSSLGMIFASLYMFWTPVGKGVVDGVQGRYFLGLAPLIALALPMIAAPPPGGRGGSGRVALAAFGTALVLSFPIYSYLEVLRVILNRFYV